MNALEAANRYISLKEKIAEMRNIKSSFGYMVYRNDFYGEDDRAQWQQKNDQVSAQLPALEEEFDRLSTALSAIPIDLY
jgi:hypothetical protein